jgi:antirestriction protein ArdC
MSNLFFHPDERLEPVAIDQPLTAGEILPIAGGLEVIHTPGHCAGQVAVLWRPGRMLFAGDVCMNKFGRKRFGDEGYAMEELVAELGSAFLSADLDLTPEIREDHTAYIGSWIKALKDDRRAIFSAASHAQRAADFLHGLQKSMSATADTAHADAA